MPCKVSVIIPVYNAEQHIIPCIESLMMQSLQECEFIFINDGSIDNSQAIIEGYAKKDSRITLLNQKNQGVSIARNTGLAAASGDYIGFVDADDTVEMDMYERLYITAEQNDCDVVISNFESKLGAHTITSSYPFNRNTVLHKEYIHHHIIPYFVRTDDLNTVWSKLYRHILIKQMDIRFPEKVALGEDGMFNMYFFAHAERCIYLDYTGYHYNDTPGSATRNILDKDYFSRAVEVYQSPLPELFSSLMDEAMVSRLKAIRLMKSVLAIIHMYAEPTPTVRFSRRYSYIRSILNSPPVRDSLPVYSAEEAETLGKYQKLMLELIRRKSMGGIYLATAYSRMRNNQSGRKLH